MRLAIPSLTAFAAPFQIMFAGFFSRRRWSEASMNIVKALHDGLVYGRRVRLLAEKLSIHLPTDARILDVGCGDGMVDSLITRLRPDVAIHGIDVLVRPRTYIPVTQFDGARIPHPDASYDVVMFVDVLHHCEDPAQLLAEAKRVTRSSVLIKDHTQEGLLAHQTLRFMDWFGNAHHGVARPNNFWTLVQWKDCLGQLGLQVRHWQGRLDLYPWPATWLFDRKLHFIAVLRRS
jgi:SAM-dependent methyltransferase